MTRSLLALPCLLSLTLSWQSPAPQPAAGRPELAGLLDFEAEHVGGVPRNWAGGPPGTFTVDDKIVHGGRWALRIERNDASASTLTAVSKTIPIDFVGAQLELRGFLRTADISNFTGLWMRQDDDGGMLALENMQARQLKGTTEWTEYSITLPLNKAAKRLVFGVLASGTGRVWADDLRLLVDGKPIADVPRAEPLKTIIDLDKEFDGGSGITLKELTKIQVANLTLLGKVWGFVKYHHRSSPPGSGTGITIFFAFFRACWPRPTSPRRAPRSINGLRVSGPCRRARRARRSSKRSSTCGRPSPG